MTATEPLFLFNDTPPDHCDRCGWKLHRWAIREGIGRCRFCVEELERGLQVEGGEGYKPEAIAALCDALLNDDTGEA